MVFLHATNVAIAKVLKGLCLILAVLYTAIVLLQVLARNYLLISMPWTDEVALILFVWSVFLGASIAVHKRVHYVVELFPARFVRLNAALSIVAEVFVLAMVVALLYGGILFFRMGTVKSFCSIRLPQCWLFVSMPIAGACMLLFSVENLIHDVKGLRTLFTQEGAR